MGFIKSGLLVITSILLFLVLLIGNTFLILSWSLSYDNVQPKVYSVIEKAVQEEGGEILNKTTINETIKKYYYTEYDCKFWDCFNKLNEQQFFLMSEMSKDYWTSRFYLMVIIAIFLSILCFVFIENKTSLPILVGGLLIIASLPFVKLNWILEKIAVGEFLDILSILFSKSYSVFLIGFVSGIVLILIGFVLKFLNIGFKISKFIEKIKSYKLVKKPVSEKDKEIK